MSAFPSQELSEGYAEDIAETEIVFTALPSLDSATQEFHGPLRQELNPLLNKPEVLPQHVEYLKNKLKLQQRRKQVISEQEDRLAELNTVLSNSASLNGKTEQLNVQAAVLMGALNNLQREFEAAQSEKETLVQEIQDLKQESLSIQQNLNTAQSESATLNKESADQNTQSAGLIDQLVTLLESSKASRIEDQQTADQLKQALLSSHNQQNDLRVTAADFSSAKEEAEAFIQRAQLSKADTEQNSRELSKLLKLNKSKSEELDALIHLFSELREELVAEKNQQCELNEKSKDQIAQTAKLNQQQSTLLEIGQSRVDELEQELKEVLSLNKKTQEKLESTEQKYEDSRLSFEKIRENYGKALKLLKRNEESLAEAGSSLKESQSQNGSFTEAMNKFHHSSEQSQQLMLKSQTTFNTLLKRNDLLERENKLLGNRLNGMRTRENTNNNSQFDTIDDIQLQEYPASRSPEADNENGFYRFMTVLAIILPLSFVAHSVISNAGAAELGNVTPSSLKAELGQGNRDLFLESQTFTPTSYYPADNLSSETR
jgi:chromosome segregation ATPase